MEIKRNGLAIQFDTGRGAAVSSLSLNGKTVLQAEKPQAFAQVHIAGGDRNSHHGLKLIDASETANAVFEGIESVPFSGGCDYVLTVSSSRIRTATHLRFYDGIDGFRSYQTVTNIGREPVALEEVDSCMLSGFCLIDGKNVRFWLPANSWHAEAQWVEIPLAELLCGRKANMKRYSVCNNGGWSTKEYLPMGLLQNKAGFILWQIENNGSWCYEMGMADDSMYLNIGGPNFQNNMWKHVLRPNESFTGVASAVVFAPTQEGAFGEITKYRRAIRRPNKDNEQLPKIFNSYMHGVWDYPSPELLKPMIDRAAELGMEYFCIDAGWHDEEKFWDKLGMFRVSKKRFPEGLNGILEYIRSRGMKVGMWVELEDIGKYCPLAETLPEECFFRSNGERYINHEKLFLDFRQPLVVARADEVIDRMVGEYGAEYIKIDFNADPGPGTEVNSDSLGDGLLEHNRAFYAWLEGVYQRHPNVVIENCASGGCRMDYRMLSLNSIQSTSDQTDYRYYPYIAANAFTAVTPEQGAVWSYPVDTAYSPEEYARRVEEGEDVTPVEKNPDIYVTTINMVNSLAGRMHLSGNIQFLRGESLAAVKEAIAYYDATREHKRNALPYMPKGFTKWGGKEACFGLRCGEKVLLYLWNLGMRGPHRIPLPASATVKAGYPKRARCCWEQAEDELRVTFDSAWDACILEITLAR